jgi:TrmH family RNA methyltransferase
MERLTSRKNPLISHLRRLGADRAYRRECGEFLCDGKKLLHEAVRWGAEITAVLWDGEPAVQLDCPAQYTADKALLDYVSPLKNAASVLFSVRVKTWDDRQPGKTLVLETVQDPGNLGTILRTANALGIDTVILTGRCADVYNPKTVRAGMGAVFRQRVLELDRAAMSDYLNAHGLRLYGAALSERSTDLRRVDLRQTAVAVGSEGQGLSDELLAMCAGELIIPMNAQCESLNAAVAAAIIMWELAKAEEG